jgi:hypothetical protein
MVDCNANPFSVYQEFCFLPWVLTCVNMIILDLIAYIYLVIGVVKLLVMQPPPHFI